MLTHVLHKIGKPVIERTSIAVDVFRLFGQCLTLLFRPPWRWREILQQTVHIGISSLPIITIATASAGLVITKEIAWHLNEALHDVTMVPGFTGQFLLRQLGVAIPAFLIVAKVGASITAEVGTMKVTEQIDALKLLKINPIIYLVFPRWIASIISLMCLTLIAISVTLVFASAMAISQYGFTLMQYFNMFQHFVTGLDVLCALVKSMIYGAVIPIIACAYGLRCKGSAEGVGTATTNSVVTSTVTVIVLDFILTYLFSLVL
jgi:phospholipid/cholesterol/gamma-HCH transport system permease protein